MSRGRGLFQGRHRKLKYTAAVLILLAGCIGTLGVLAFTSLISTATYKITDLKVQQKGIFLEVSWKDQGSKGYEVFLQSNAQRPQVYTTEENHCRIELEDLSKKYKVTVTAKSEEGGLSGASSVTVKTHRVGQKIMTDQPEYEGLQGKSDKVRATAHGTIAFKSSDPSVVAVDEKGALRYGKAGFAEITMSVEQGPRYRPARKKVKVTVYPEKLKAPTLRQDAKGTTDFKVKLTWEPVTFAKGYRLCRLDPAKGEYVEVKEFKTKDSSAEVLRDNAKYTLQAFAKVDGTEVESDPSAEMEITSLSVSADARKSSHNIRTLDFSNLEVVATITGSGAAKVPQSMSRVGKNYVVTYVDGGGTVGALVTYNKQGERISSFPISGMGHANGSTYDPNTGKIYTVKTHQKIRSAECTTFDPKDGSGQGSFNLPKVTSGIAYDETCNKYYLSKGNELYVTDTDFKVEKFIWKRIRYNHAQDIGAHNGVALVCTWVSGNESYIDLYRMADGAYLGGYHVPIGEIESCFVEDKHLIILMNNATRAGDCILRTVDPISLP